MRPRVLVTTDRRLPAPKPPGARVRPPRPEAFLGEAYVHAVRAAGGVALLVPPGDEDLDALLDTADAIVLTGGDFDIHPAWYGEAPVARLDRVEPGRTALELGLAKGALARGVPLLGICGGMQALAVAAGGRLVQDVPKPDRPDDGRIDHEQPTDPATPWHTVRVEAPATAWFGAEVDVNSTHHQAVRHPGALIACGWAPDGTIEIVASAVGFALGVQWHPEVLGDLRPYQALVRAAQRTSP